MDARSGASDRLTAFGTQLLEAHIWLREMLEDLSDAVDDYIDGKGLPPRDLRAHCLTFCTALDRHHKGEDAVAFPAIAHDYPELRGVLATLRTDHNQLDWLMQGLRKVLDALPDEPDPATSAKARQEITALSAVMLTHFIYEEKKIVAALNALDVPEWRADPPAFLLVDD
ncbi:hemerythrin domain-containing protein [Actinokineospora auranticolor]|uniref:Hemerythrin HHE cation binding domain-containing protein n=1 Tax=Actinokineospora auranticolor TaxID=155976 RepID=A0A2S6GBK6_9PSEU|nr:hemerythrin domain-containing protein [Actinokineospora auranticolor]PPK60545.1 hemerythrin HHE cation binding domain-containing protein [Actinokineospora auranticolor]